MLQSGKIAALALTIGLATMLPPTALAQEVQARPAPTTHELQVILVRALPGELSMPDLPEDAQSALRDISQVLSFRRFELIDTGWLRTHEAARARLGKAAAFEVNLGIDSVRSSNERIIIEYFELNYRHFEPHPDPDVDRLLYGDTENLLGTSFGLEVGETVVVGTSRINGDDEALIVLLKAVK